MLHKSGKPDLCAGEGSSVLRPTMRGEGCWKYEALSKLACRKNELTRVTRIFQKRAFTKAAHDARVGDRYGLFCRLGARR